MKALRSLFTALAIVLLPVIAPAVTTQPATSVPLVEQTAYAYDAVPGTGFTDNALTGSEALRLTVPLFGQIAGFVAAKNLPALRAQYEAEVRLLEDVGLNARAAGQTTEATARMLNAERNALKLKYREFSPSESVKLYEQRNLEKYGDPVGPSVEYFRAKGKTWEEIIDSAARPGGKDLGF